MVGTPDFQELFEAAPGLYLVLAIDSPRFTIVGVSENYLRATMTQRDAIVGQALFDVFPDNHESPSATGVTNLRASLERVIGRREADSMAVQKYDIRKPDGDFEERFWSPVNTPVIGKGGTLDYIIHRVEDVTDFLRMKDARSEMEVEVFRRAQEIQQANAELRKLQGELEQRVEQREQALRKSEEQLRHAQKLEAVGRLAGGIAHDFNNLLSVILSYCEMMRPNLGERDPMREGVEEIHRAGVRAADLTRQLLAFSRRQVVELAILDLNEVLVSLAKILQRVVGEDIELKTVAAVALGKVRADRGQIEQVVMNLVVNARDALPNGGKLTIETGDVTLDEAYAAEHIGVTPGPHVMLAISDTGIGMDSETQTRIFEPFFTTKERDKGTGLGLSTVFGIVKQSGGHIWLYSELGQGTTFKLYFPRVEGVDARPAAVREQSTKAKGRETILLADDQAQVRAVAATILRRAGYHVLEAPGPGEALLICEEHPLPIHLLLTDVVMPKMNGRELAERIHAKYPTLKVLFMSGYTDDVILQHGVLDARMSFIEKPLTPPRLLQKVREALDA